MLRPLWLLCALCALASAQSAPSPDWARSFSVVSKEGGGQIPFGEATLYYDSTVPAEMKTRKSGLTSQDGVCQGHNGTCTDLTSGGYRYIIFEDTKECCLLGTWDHGCGPVAPNWVTQNKGVYKGQMTVEGTLSDVWDVQGFQLNTWAQTAQPYKGQGITPVKMAQGDFIDVYQLETFQRRTFPSEFFSIPSICSPEKKCPSQYPCNIFATQ